MTKKTRHAAFLIRWQDDGDQTRWQSTVENAYTGEKVHFLDKNDLLRFLWHALYGSATFDLTETDAEAHHEKTKRTGRR